MPTDYPSLIPVEVARQVIASIADEQSAVMQLATTIQMPSGIETLPLVASAPGPRPAR